MSRVSTNRSRLVDAGISYNDFQSMQTESHGYFGMVPEQPWAFSDEKVRAVVIYKLWRQGSSTNFNKVPDPKDLTEVRALEQRAMARLCKTPITSRHLDKVKQYGGLLAYWTSLIYRRYRLKEGTFDLAARYGMDGNAIRQQLYRLNGIARMLYPADVISAPMKGDCHRDPTSKHAIKIATRDERTKAREALEQQVMALLEQGLTINAVANTLCVGWKRINRIRQRRTYVN